jgi:hypothetical protein
MIIENLLYYIAICYNITLEKYRNMLEYLKNFTERVNKVLIGDAIEWIICNDGVQCIRKGDVASVNFPFAVGYLYNPLTNQFFQLTGNVKYKYEKYNKFDYIGGELRFMNNKYDITDWLNMQRWNGSVIPSEKSIAIAWLIKNGLLGLMAYNEWQDAELNLVDSCGDDVIMKIK